MRLIPSLEEEELLWAVWTLRVRADLLASPASSFSSAQLPGAKTERQSAAGRANKGRSESGMDA